MTHPKTLRKFLFLTACLLAAPQASSGPDATALWAGTQAAFTTGLGYVSSKLPDKIRISELAAYIPCKDAIMQHGSTAKKYGYDNLATSNALTAGIFAVVLVGNVFTTGYSTPEITKKFEKLSKTRRFFARTHSGVSAVFSKKSYTEKKNELFSVFRRSTPSRSPNVGFARRVARCIKANPALTLAAALMVANLIRGGVVLGKMFLDEDKKPAVAPAPAPFSITTNGSGESFFYAQDGKQQHLSHINGDQKPGTRFYTKDGDQTVVYEGDFRIDQDEKDDSKLFKYDLRSYDLSSKRVTEIPAPTAPAHTYKVAGVTPPPSAAPAPADQLDVYAFLRGPDGQITDLM